MPNKTSIRKALKNLLKSVWLFPIILAFVLAGLTAAKISGSSIGSYHQIIYGSESQDPDLLFGHPRPIRSDEWLSGTQMTIAQANQDYPLVNKNLGTGKNMSLIGDAPYKDWSSLFKPHNLSFFFLPLEHAFAFKWWVLLFLLIVSCYFFTLRLLPGKRLFAALFGTAAGLSPFVFWWYANGTFVPMFCGFFIMILGMRIINGEPVKFLEKKGQTYSNIIYCLTLVYLLVTFALVLYPPFQVPVAGVVTIFLLGYVLDNKFRDKVAWRPLLRKLSVFLAAIIITGVILAVFISTREEALRSVTNTAYPGQRVSTSGHMNPLHVFDSFLMPQLQSESKGTKFFKNQSESSNFILLSPFLILPALFLTFHDYKKNRRIDWLFVSIQACVLLLFARAFIPFGDVFYKLMLLHLVPNERLLIGMGLASIILTLLVLKKVGEAKIRARTLRIWSAAYSLVCLTVLMWIGFRVANLYPLFISHPLKITVLAVAFSAIVFFVLTGRLILAGLTLLIFSIGSVIRIHPIYQGLGWVNDNQLFNSMQMISSPDDTWVAADNITLENFGSLANRDTISGIQPYPDFKIWQQAALQSEDIYNRFAHVVFVSSAPFSEPLHLVQPDFFLVKISCSKFIIDNVDYVLNISPLNQDCVKLKETVTYPAVTFYLYEVKP